TEPQDKNRAGRDDAQHPKGVSQGDSGGVDGVAAKSEGKECWPTKNKVAFNAAKRLLPVLSEPSGICSKDADGHPKSLTTRKRVWKTIGEGQLARNFCLPSNARRPDKRRPEKREQLGDDFARGFS